MTMKLTSLREIILMVLVLAFCLPATHLLNVHFHVYDHQHELGGHEGPQVIYHSDLAQSTPPHHQETAIVETAQQYFTKFLKFQPNIGFVILVFLLLPLAIPSGLNRLRKDTELFWKRRCLRPSPARAPPLQ